MGANRTPRKNIPGTGQNASSTVERGYLQNFSHYIATLSTWNPTALVHTFIDTYQLLYQKQASRLKNHELHSKSPLLSDETAVAIIVEAIRANTPEYRHEFQRELYAVIHARTIDAVAKEEYESIAHLPSVPWYYFLRVYEIDAFISK